MPAPLPSAPARRMEGSRCGMSRSSTSSLSTAIHKLSLRAGAAGGSCLKTWLRAPGVLSTATRVGRCLLWPSFPLAWRTHAENAENADPFEARPKSFKPCAPGADLGLSGRLPCTSVLRRRLPRSAIEQSSTPGLAESQASCYPRSATESSPGTWTRASSSCSPSSASFFFLLG